MNKILEKLVLGVCLIFVGIDHIICFFMRDKK